MELSDTFRIYLALKVGFYNFAPEEYEPFDNKALVIATFGHPVDDDQLRVDSFERNGVATLSEKISQQKDALLNLLFAEGRLRSVIKKNSAFDFAKDKTFENSKQMFDWISQNLFITAEVCGS